MKYGSVIIFLIATAALSGCAELSEAFLVDSPAQTYPPAPTATQANHGGPATQGIAGAVSINGNVIDDQTLAQFAQIYNARPVPGDYWYDAASGLWGRVGMPTEGCLRPGHNFGPIPANASGGNTGVMVNGRILQASEVMSLTAMLGYVAPGQYWLDQTGNYGQAGYAIPLGNLFQLASNMGRQGGGSSGGDNFWSTGFSSGNYDSSSGAGYVSLPNGGFVTHGM